MKLLHYTAVGDLEKVKALITSRVSIHAVDYSGRTCLHLAAERGHLEIVRLLLELGANADSEDMYGETPWTLALLGSHDSVHEALKEVGANAASGIYPNFLLQGDRTQYASFALMEAVPRPIALAMLKGTTVEPVSRDMASVLFTDIVGFTTISSSLDAHKVLDLLNRLFRKFDRLAYIHGVQKIDVIGDAYVAATNFTDDQPTDHAARLAHFALAVVAAAAETVVDEDGDQAACVAIRAGIHCGPVTGAVLRPGGCKYTLMGDTAQVAAQMESTGVAAQVQCSAAAAAVLRQQAHDLVLKPRCVPHRPLSRIHHCPLFCSFDGLVWSRSVARAAPDPRCSVRQNRRRDPCRGSRQDLLAVEPAPRSQRLQLVPGPAESFRPRHPPNPARCRWAREQAPRIWTRKAPLQQQRRRSPGGAGGSCRCRAGVKRRSGGGADAAGQASRRRPAGTRALADLPSVATVGNNN